jgi:hypothetical protein
MVIKYTFIFYCKTPQPKKICSNCYFWFENKPPGKPGAGATAVWKYLGKHNLYLHTGAYSAKESAEHEKVFPLEINTKTWKCTNVIIVIITTSCWEVQL